MSSAQVTASLRSGAKQVPPAPSPIFRIVYVREIFNFMRKLLILLSTALFLTGCGAAANREALKQASETSGVQESKATEYGVIGEA